MRALLKQGKYDTALSMLAEALPSQLVTTDIPLERAALQAWAYKKLGKDSESDQAFQEARRLSFDGPDSLNDTPSSLKRQALNTLGQVYIDRNELARADEIFLRNLDVARQQKDSYLQATSLLNLSLIALHLERFDEAQERSQAAVQAAQRIGARSILEESQGNIAWASYKLGNFDDALDGFKKAEEEAEELGEASDRTEWLIDIGLSSYRLGHTSEAETNYKKALEIAEANGEVEKEIEAHVALAELLLAEGTLDLAAQHTDRALKVARSAKGHPNEMDALFIQSLIAARQQKTDESNRILMDIEQNSAISPSLRWQVENALANQYAKVENTALADRWYRQSITTFETQRETISREESKLPFANHAESLYDDYVRFLVNHKTSDEAFQWLDLGRARTLEQGLGMSAPNFKATIQESLDAPAIARRLHGVILVYSLAPEESYLWAVNSSGIRFFRLPRQEEIDAHVKNYQRVILNSRDPLTDAYADGMALYRVLVEPAASLIPKGSPVFIIPDGSLSTLNFDTLLAPGGGIHYWIEDATITNASSLKLLAAFHPEKRAKTPKKLLLIGNPISPDEKFPDLPKAADEVTNVAKHFQSSEVSVFTQKQALPSTYLDSTPGNYSLIHFVAHGTSSSASPLDSAIVLTRNPANPDSFKLYARDVIQHQLHADVVAISACYGSGSRIYGGEGLVGLSWAFLHAGAHYVVGSLWQVSDSTAPQIMDRLYAELAAGRPADVALRDAKLSMLKNSQNVFRKPLYWATFQLYGGA